MHRDLSARQLTINVVFNQPPVFLQHFITVCLLLGKKVKQFSEHARTGPVRNNDELQK